MKKFLLSVSAIVFATSIFAQQKRMADMPNKHLMNEVVNTLATVPVEASSNSAVAPLPIWSDDFSDPANWVIDHDPNACSLDWLIGVNSCQGSYQINDIVSTSASNGWAMIDSDFYGGATGGTEVEDSWLTMANPVDLNGFPYVVVEFEAQYRSYNSECPYIVVGIGDGAGNVTWPDLTPTTDISTLTNVFKPFPGYTSGDQTTNPELITVDISTALSGLTSIELADIYIRFHWTGTWGYAWFIDDVAISETPNNGIALNDEVIGGYWVDYANYTGAGLNNIIGLDYSHTPQSQLANHPFVFEAIVKNTGIAEQSVVLHYDVTGSGTASGMSPAIVLNGALGGAEEGAFSAAPSFGNATTSIGSYSVDIWAEADSAGAGVTTTTLPDVTKIFEVTDYIYGKDLGEQNQTGAYTLGGPMDQNHITTRYEMYANESLTGLRAYIGGNSVVGAEVKAVIYEADTTAADDLIFLAESDNYEITAQDLGAWVDIPFLSPINLFSGYAYDFGIAGFQHPTDTTFIGVSGPMMYAGEHSSFDEGGLSTQSAGTPTWYYITSAPMVRMNFDPALISAVTDVKQTVFNTFPNPTNGIFTIELESNAKYDVTVNNVLGQTVVSTITNGISTAIDLSNFDKGVYSVELRKNDATYTEKVIVK